MEISLKKLTPAIAEDFFRFFDHDAFSDHEEWTGCYCLESHISAGENSRLWGKIAKRRERAGELIQKGIMTGYLVYDGPHIVGWCNAGDKATYRSICENADYATDPAVRGAIKIIYCIDIAPDYRGKGIANRIVEQVLADAKEKGYSCVEAYPLADKKFAYQYHGPVRLYEKYGFEVYRKLEEFYLMRKTL